MNKRSKRGRDDAMSVKDVSSDVVVGADPLVDIREAYLKNTCGWQVNAGDPQNRVDFPGTAGINELVKTHDVREKEVGPRPVSVPKEGEKFKLPKLSFNFVKHFVHPLHNFLQFHCGMHTDDEMQILLMPPTTVTRASSTEKTAKGKRGDADDDIFYSMKKSKKGPKQKKGIDSGLGVERAQTTSTPGGYREAFVATNTELITQKDLDQATKGWNLMGVWKVHSLTLVNTGEPGRHAEQKLLDLCQGREFIDRFPALSVGEKKSRAEGSPSTLRAMIVGERLPCATCAIYAHSVTQGKVGPRMGKPRGPVVKVDLLPSHGHFYFSTVPQTPLVGEMSPSETLSTLKESFAVPR